MNANLILAAVTTALTVLAAVPAQAMGAGQNPLPQAMVLATSVDTAAAGQRSCRAVPAAGTQQVAGGTRGSCVVVAQTADVAGAGGLRTRTLMTRGHTVQAVRVAAAN